MLARGRANAALQDVIRHLSYDACVITGDFRGRTYGPFERTLNVVRDAVSCIFGVLANHDTAHIVPGLEATGIRMLLNENEALYRDGGQAAWTTPTTIGRTTSIAALRLRGRGAGPA